MLVSNVKHDKYLVCVCITFVKCFMTGLVCLAHTIHPCVNEHLTNTVPPSLQVSSIGSGDMFKVNYPVFQAHTGRQSLLPHATDKVE